MTQFKTKTYKNSPVIYKIRKPRYYYQDVCFSGKEHEIKNVEIKPFEGLDYNCDHGYLNVNEKKLWNGDTLFSNRYVFAPKIYNTQHIGLSYSTVGKVILDDNYVSTGYATASYLKFNMSDLQSASSWEMMFKVKTGSNVTTNQKIFSCCKGTGNAGRFGMGICVISSHMQFFLSSTGSTWLFDLTGTYEILPDTEYWVKATFDGYKYVLSISTDGQDFIEDISFESQSKLYAPIASYHIGIYSTSSFQNPWLGEIHLKDCYIEADDKKVWIPTTYKQNVENTYWAKITYPNAYSVVGNLHKMDNAFNNFSASNYIKVNYQFKPESNPWEMNFKIKTGATVSSTNQYIYQSCSGTGSAGRWGIIVYYTDVWKLGISADNSSWLVSGVGEYAIQPNTTYWIKVVFDGTKYELFYSLDGEEYILDISHESTTPIYESLPNTYMGIYSTSSFQNPNLGCIYIDDCYIKINDEITWDTGVTSTSFEEMFGCLDNTYDTNEEKTYVAYGNSNDVILKENDEDTEGYIWCNELTVPQHQIVETYFKNFVKIGSPVLNQDKIMSGFSSTNYILTPFLFGENPYEFISKGLITSQADGNMLLVDDLTVDKLPEFYLQKASKKLHVYGSSSYAGTNVIPVNVWYWFRLLWDGTNLSWYTKPFADGETVETMRSSEEWILENSITSNAFNTPSVFRLGGPTGTTTYYWHGSIDLLNTAYFENGKLFWKPLMDINK
jgi:hypothetical protein